MAYGACAMDANPKVGLPSSSLLYRVDGWHEREIDEEGAPVLTHIVNCTYTTTIAQMGRTGCVCGKTEDIRILAGAEALKRLGTTWIESRRTESQSGNQRLARHVFRTSCRTVKMVWRKPHPHAQAAQPADSTSACSITVLVALSCLSGG